MADLKISGLPASTTPLAGTEVLPIVQSSTTKQVSVANLTAGRSVATGALTVTGAMSATTSITSGNGLVASGATYPASGTAAELGYNGTSVYLRGYDRTGGAYKAVSINEGLSVAGGSAGDTTATGNFVQGTAAKGINFTANTPAAGMTSQLLNWYEEGTWTPTITFGGGSTGLTYSTQSGNYTRVGRLVTVRCDVQLSNKGSSTGSASIGGLPFTQASIGYISGAAGFVNGMTYTGNLIFYSNGGTTSVILAAVSNGTFTSLTDTAMSNTSEIMFTWSYMV